MKRRTLAVLTASIMAGTMLTGFHGNAESETNQVLVTTTEELLTALEGAQAGDEIIVREGVYQNDEWRGEWAAFFSHGEGTAEKPIILRSEDPEHPATISGASQESKNVLYITGDHWIIKDLEFTNAALAITLDNSNYTAITGCEVHGTGQEIIHIRDGSSYCLVEDCDIYDAGNVSPQYGEGVYIGSAYSAEGYDFNCHYNIVRNCRFGPDITADHVDIKEYTIGNLVEYCTFDGTGIQNLNGGNSFIEVKGNNTIVRWNTGYRNGNENILYGFDLSQQVEGWGQNNQFYENTLYLDTTDCYEVKGWNCSAQVFRNTVEPAEILCDGNRIMQVIGFDYDGDVTEDGLLNDEDPARLQDYLLGRDIPYISNDNADTSADAHLDAFDLCILKKKMLSGDTGTPKISVEFTKEEDGYWRMCDGLGERTLTFYLTGSAGAHVNMGWGYYDQNYVNDDGSTGKWIQNSIGDYYFDENGETTITVEIPADARRIGLDVYNYLDDSGSLDQSALVLTEVIAE